MKKSIIVFLSWLILVTIYRIYTTKQREGFQNKVACQLIENSQQMKDYITNSKYDCLLNKYIKWENLTDMGSMFKNNNTFNQDISEWNVSGVTDMSLMFNSTRAFNKPLNWGEKVKNVKDMSLMFAKAILFNQDISEWNVSEVTNMYAMFRSNAFNKPLNWGKHVKNVTNMAHMFRGSSAFNQDISGWDVRGVRDMTSMFYSASAFNQDISGWDVSGVADFTDVFYDSGLAKDRNKTNLKKIYCSWKHILKGKKAPLTNLKKEMDRYFSTNKHNCPTTTAKPTTTVKECYPIENLKQMKDYIKSEKYVCLKNKNITWDNLTDMDSMFGDAIAFNQDISNWEVGNVANMDSMFGGATAFNQDISSWKVDKVTTMEGMFQGASAFNNNGNPLNWGEKVKNVTDMKNMFWNATAFNQDISGWNVSSVTDFTDMFKGLGTTEREVRMSLVGQSWNSTVIANNKTNLKNIYCSWTKRLEDKPDPLKSLTREIKLRLQFLPNCPTTTAKPTTTVGCRPIENSKQMKDYIKNGKYVCLKNKNINWENLTNMDAMFYSASAFNKDISDWNVSSVTDMKNMFYGANAFNKPLSTWKVDKVTTMEGMFWEADAFNQPLSTWKVDKVTDMKYMFRDAYAFNQPLSNWEVGKVTDMKYMFMDGRAFNQDISGWDVSGVTDMYYMFCGAIAFNQDISDWNVSGVTDFEGMFMHSELGLRGQGGGHFPPHPLLEKIYCSWKKRLKGKPGPLANLQKEMERRLLGGSLEARTSVSYCNKYWPGHDCRPIENSKQMKDYIKNEKYVCLKNKYMNWDNLTDMDSMFRGDSAFNDENVKEWVVSGVTNMKYMFVNAVKFNQYISNWDVKNVRDMSVMFYGAKVFNQDISNWNVSSVTDMYYMFYNTSAFNQPLNKWGKNVKNVTTMEAMFRGATAFNQDISDWNVSGSTNMRYMFYGANAFNKPLNKWGDNVKNVTNMAHMFYQASAFNQDISDWNVSGVTDFEGMFQDSGLGLRGNRRDTHPLLEKIYCTWKNKLSGVPLENLQKEMERRLLGGSWKAQTASVSYCNEYWPGHECRPIENSKQMKDYIKNEKYVCLKNKNITWDNLTDMKSMFDRQGTFNDENVKGWVVSGVTNMKNMFVKAEKFNQYINNWDVSGVTNMYAMFYGAKVFNQYISNWDVSGVTNMYAMFYGAKVFNQDISLWDVSSVTDFTLMFKGSGFAMDQNKKNLKKIYCSWKKKLKDKPLPLKSLDKEMEKRIGYLPKNCDEPGVIRHGPSKKIYSGYECLPNGDKNEVYLGKHDSKKGCEAACIEKAAGTDEECKWFIYGQKNGPKDGSCWWEKKCDKLEPDKYNVYEINNNDGQTRECPGEYPRLGWHEHGGRRYCYTDDPPRLNEKGLYACTHGDTFKDDGWGTFAEGGGADWVEKCVL